MKKNRVRKSRDTAPLILTSHCETHVLFVNITVQYITNQVVRATVLLISIYRITMQYLVVLVPLLKSTEYSIIYCTYVLCIQYSRQIVQKGGEVRHYTVSIVLYIHNTYRPRIVSWQWVFSIFRLFRLVLCESREESGDI